jgi:hypothetical protein
MFQRTFWKSSLGFQNHFQELNSHTWVLNSRIECWPSFLKEVNIFFLKGYPLLVCGGKCAFNIPLPTSNKSQYCEHYIKSISSTHDNHWSTQVNQHTHLHEFFVTINNTLGYTTINSCFRKNWKNHVIDFCFMQWPSFKNMQLMTIDYYATYMQLGWTS